MGADFIFAVAKVPKDESVARRKINELPLDQCMVLADEVMGYSIEAPEGPEYVAAEVRTRLHEALTAVTMGGDRSIGHLHIHDTDYYITGGMSWGDNPTDTFDDIMFLDWSGVTE